MYENMTYAALLADAKSYIGDGVQKGEGSLVFNALSVLAYELEKLYMQANYILNQTYADTADFEHLQKIAANRAIYRREATAAKVKIAANTAVPVGARFSLKSYNYSVTEELDAVNHYYAAVCEEPGSGPNELTGTLIPITYIDGLTSASITEILVAGSDAESQEDLYERYLASFSTESFAGNVAAYKAAVNAIDGVGGCKVKPVWNGAGTVKVVVIGSNGRAISQYLVDEIQEAAVPTQGTGYGFAPIDHTVTIESVAEVTVNIATSITYVSGYSWETIGDQIIAKIEGYLESIADAWSSGTADMNSMVYVSRLEAAVLEVTGIMDITNTRLNGSTSNLTLLWNQIPVKGTVTAS